MPRLHYSPPPPVPLARGALSPRERALIAIMLALVNDLRDALDLPPLTEADALALVHHQDRK